MQKIKYDPDHHGSFEEEWGIHKGCREWWYSTSILVDEELCEIRNAAGDLVGYAFAELLPGVLNQDLLKQGGGSSLSVNYHNQSSRLDVACDYPVVQTPCGSYL